jgi:hypothetical protein
VTAEQVAARLASLPPERMLEVAALLIDTRDALHEAYAPGVRRSDDRPAIAHRRYLLVSALARIDGFLAEQFDIVDRLIEQMSNPGDLVLDPFSGLGTVAYCALKQRRRGLGIELNPAYHADAVAYCAAAEREASMPTLFDVLDAVPAAEEEPAC